MPDHLDIRGINQIAELIDGSPLGPASVTEHPHAPGVLWVHLTAPAPRKLRSLAAWQDLTTVQDMTIGKYHHRDPTLFLHLRGHFQHGLPVIVTTPFDENTEPDHVAALKAHIDEQDAHNLITQLAAINPLICR
ncbi:hypothetical protein [Amycolatopsis sp. NPDC058986]|uniref:hypothetical protein n=1 Tax=unclassified Amycolatopsis TaxID=2618356 RepID=UPI00366F7F76